MAVEDPTKKQIEEVDPEVAEILGLEDNFDLEQSEYMTLLKERMVKGAFEGKEKLSEEDLAKLANERKRIRDLKESKFTAPKKTVNADSFFGRKKEEGSQEQKPITDVAKLLPGSGGAIQKSKPPEEEPQEEKKDDTADKLKEVENFLSGTLLGVVKEIRGLTEDILSVLQKQGAADKKGSELSRKESEKGGKRSKEKDLETKEEKKGLGLVEKIAKPFKSIFDTIINFITMVLLGSAVNWLWSVFKNPMMLLKPIQGLIDGITGFFNTVIQFIDGMVVQPVRSFIDTINSALNGFIGLLNMALKMLPGSPQIGQANIPNIPEAPVLEAPNITGESKEPPSIPTPPAAAQPKAPPAPAQPKVQLKFTGGQIGTQTPILRMNSGGSIKSPKEKKGNSLDTVSKEGGIVNSKTTAFDISGLGQDKFLTALHQGEYVLKPGAVEELGGKKELDEINKRHGGSTSVRTASLGDVNIRAMSTGGLVGGRGGGPGPRGVSTSTSNLKLLATNAKTTYYDPSLGGINASGHKTKEGLPATSTGEGYRPNIFSAAAFPPMIAKLPSGNLANAPDFPGGKTLKKPLNVVVTASKGNQAVVRLNDVGPGVKGHSPNHMLDFSVASKKFLGTGPGFKIEGPTSNKPGPLSGTAAPASESGSSGSPSPDGSGVAPGAAPATDPGGSPSGSSIPDSAYTSHIIKGDAGIGPLSIGINVAGPKGGPSSMDVRRNWANTLKAREATAQRERLGVFRGSDGRWQTHGVSDSAVGRNPWWQVWNKKGATAERKEKQEALARSLAAKLNRESGLNRPVAPVAPSRRQTSSSSSSSTSTSSVVEIKQTGDKAKDMSVWAKANPTLATALAEKERIRGTAQTNNPLMKDFISKLPLNSPSIQASEVANLGKGFQGLSENKNAFIGVKPLILDKKETKPSETKTTPSTSQPITPLISDKKQTEGSVKSSGTSPTPPTSSTPSTSQPISKPSTPLTPPAPGGVTLDQYGRRPDLLPTKEQRDAAANARQQALAMGFSKGSPEYEKMVAQATMKPSSIAPSSITSPTQPTIPQPPDTKPNISMLPLPSTQGGKVPTTGTTKSGSTPVVHFNSYDSSEHNIITTAALYNIWGM
jgi:hypothetical protein